MNKKFAIALAVLSLLGTASFNLPANAQYFGFNPYRRHGGATADQMQTAINLRNQINNLRNDINVAASRGQLNGFEAQRLQGRLENISSQLESRLSYAPLSFGAANDFASRLSYLTSELNARSNDGRMYSSPVIVPGHRFHHRYWY